MTKTGGRIQGLDLIRGVAIALVMLRHAWPSTFDGAGIVGVVMFFALSGYLITGIIVRDIDHRGRVNYKRFYTNRALRLLPALAVMLIVFTIGELIMGPTGGIAHLFVGVAIGGLYLQDLAPFLAYPGINHLWTLGVEEQFYLIWPALMLFLVSRHWLKRGLAAAIAIAVAVCALSVILALKLLEIQVIYALPTSWAAALIVGGAAYVFRDRVASLLRRAPGRWAIAAAVVLAAFSMFPNAKLQPITYLIGAPLIGLCTVVVINYVKRWERIPSRALSPLLGLGVISYGAYLWNGPMTHWPIDIAGWPSWTSIPLTIAAATISWWTVERYALSRKARLAAPPLREVPAEVSGELT